jgi:hypothetical protein
VSTWPLVKFVDSPSTSATVRFDCNDLNAAAPRRVADFDPGVPTLEGDPDAIGQQWGFRSPSVTVRFKGTKANALAALSALSREQLRRTNWVMFQLSSDTSPRWFKTYRTGYESLSLARVDVDRTSGRQGRTPDTWEIRVPLVADAFMYGARVAMSTFQVIQGPTDLTGPVRTAMHVVLPAIQGDAPTGLRVAITPGATLTSGNDNEWLVGCISGEAAMVDPVIDIGTGDGFTAGTGTAAPTTDATYSGGSYRAVTVGAASGLISRLTGSLAAQPPGRYKIQLRCEADNTTLSNKSYLFTFGQDASGVTVYGPTTQVTIAGGSPSVTFQGWVDLGEFTLPFGYQAVDDISPTAPATPFSLKIGTADGSAGAVRIDAFKLIPVAGPKVRASYLMKALYAGNHALNGGKIGIFDGNEGAYWGTDTGGTLLIRSPGLKGSFPVADPAAPQNLLIVMATSRGNTLAAGPYTTGLNAQAAVDVSYYPRFLHIGDGT